MTSFGLAREPGEKLPERDSREQGQAQDRPGRRKQRPERDQSSEVADSGSGQEAAGLVVPVPPDHVDQGAQEREDHDVAQDVVAAPVRLVDPAWREVLRPVRWCALLRL